MYVSLCEYTLQVRYEPFNIKTNRKYSAITGRRLQGERIEQDRVSMKATQLSNDDVSQCFNRLGMTDLGYGSQQIGKVGA